MLGLLAGYQEEGIYWLEQQHKCVGKEAEINFEMLLIEQHISYTYSEAVAGISCQQLLLVWAPLEWTTAPWCMHEV